MTPEYGPHGWRAVFTSIGVIFIGLGVLIVLPIMLMPRLGIQLDLRGRTLIALAGTLITELILFGFLWHWLEGQGRKLSDIGWGRPTTPSAVLVGVVFGLGYSAFTLTNPLMRPNALEISLFKLAGCVVGIAGAVVEECVFRGYIITELESIKTSTLVQILVSAVAFGIIHIGFNLTGVIIRFLMGIVLATIYVIGKRSLTPSIVSPVTINILVEPWLLLFIVTMYSRLGQALSR